MGVLRPILGVLLAIGGASCSDPPPTDAAIRLTLDTSDLGACASPRCEDYRMSCGATVSLRLTDPNSGELLVSNSGEPLAVCLHAPVNVDICSLADLAPRMALFGMPARTMRVEVAVWNGDEVSTASCPRTSRFELFDAFGRPQTNFSPQPAFAGATYFRAGIDTDVVVPLACPNPQRLDEATCAANLPTRVSVNVTDIGTMQPLRKESAGLVAVRVGQAREVSDDQGGSLHVLDASDTHPLSLNNNGAAPRYQADIQLAFISDQICSTTLEDVAQATTNVFCQDPGASDHTLSLTAHLLRKPIVDSILQALGLQSFPDTGLVIGRVVDQALTPLAGVAVTPSTGSVLYLNDDLSLVSQGLSSNSAFFVSTNAPYGATWTASHFDGRRHSGNPRGGLIQGKLSTVIIRMTGDVIGQ